MTENEQLLKIREDTELIVLTPCENSDHFELANASCSWAKKGDEVDSATLRSQIEPWLTALCQSEHLSLLVGSGLTRAVYKVATEEKLSVMEVAKSGDFGDHDGAINKSAEKYASESSADKACNFEDQIRAANDLLQGLKILGLGGDQPKKSKTAVKELGDALEQIIKGLAQEVLNGEKGIISSKKKSENAFNCLVSFLMSFASRTGTRDRLHLFTTNYDRVIEAGAEIAGMHLLDRFVGNLAPIFRSSRLNLDLHYNPPGIRGEPRYLEGVARFTKLHGSLDWINRDRNIRRMSVPFGATDLSRYLQEGDAEPKDWRKLMIYPNAAKDRQTADYPFVELFRDFAAAICRPNHTLVTYGYGFGDDHINRVINDMLTIPSTHLVIISHGDRSEQIRTEYEKLGRRAQISVLIGNHLGDLQALVKYYLPKPAIDRTMLRMAKLLKARGLNSSEPDEKNGDENSSQHLENNSDQ